MPKGTPRAGKRWERSPGLALALGRAQELVGSMATVRETRVGGLKLCEVGHADMSAPVFPQPRPMIVLASGGTWFAAFEALAVELERPEVREALERHDDLLAALVAERNAHRAEEGA